MKNFLSKLKPFKRSKNLDLGPISPNDTGEGPSLPSFQLVQDEEHTQRLFRRMREELIQSNELTRSRPGETPKLRQEWGKLPEGREYFYLQPWNEEGLLFEEAQKGWIISKAHKVPQNNQFMRESNAWDVVTVFEPRNQGMLRLSSSRFGDDLLSFPLYQEALIEALPLDRAERRN